MRQINIKRRTKLQALTDFLTFPIRALTLFEIDKWGLTSLRSERFYYSAKEITGSCLDVGCGKYNLFIKKFLNNGGKGIDVYKYDGLTSENIVSNITHFPFKSLSFDTVSFIASINHIPKQMRLKELREACRVLRPRGKIIVTMGNPLIEIVVHKYVFLYDKIFKTNYDVDTERGMKKGEEYYLTDQEIINLLSKAGFSGFKRKVFTTQWGFNHLISGTKNR